MKFLVRFVAFYWDNYQGGSGYYVDKKMVIDIDLGSDPWDEIHLKIKEHLKRSRPHDQTVYSKEQREYTICEALLL